MALVGSDEITLEELQLAARNHGMPLEALRYPLTPSASTTCSRITTSRRSTRLVAAARRGTRAEESSLSLDELKARPYVRVPVTMECAGNGRAKLSPRPGQPAVAAGGRRHAEWGGTPLRPLLEEAGVLDGAVEVLFTGLDRGSRRGRAVLRAQPLGRGRAPRTRFCSRGRSTACLFRRSTAFRSASSSGWYGMANVKWLDG